MRRRGASGTDALETINAAATAIASGETRASHASVQKRRWGSFWSLYWCFGWNKNKRIGHVASETSATGSDGPATEYSSQLTSIVLPFVAPPSSPASFFLSEPPSATQSPTGILSMTSVSANMYSPGETPSMFAIGPYAHETQLVSPPVFSTYTTEPSTAPYTPPPESVHHMTTPSSPEVPFARVVDPTLQNGGQKYPFSHQYEFQSYHLQPGSPVSHLISPCSGTSSPFPDREFAAAHPFFLDFKTGNYPPKLLDLDRILRSEWESRQESDAVTPDDNSTLNHHRVSFEITDEEVIRCVEKKAVELPESSSPPPSKPTEIVKHTGVGRSVDKANGENETLHQKNRTITLGSTNGENETLHPKNRTITLGSTKDFNFENVEGGSSDEPSISASEWWVKEKVVAEDGDHSTNWSFFPVMQTGVS